MRGRTFVEPGTPVPLTAATVGAWHKRLDNKRCAPRQLIATHSLRARESATACTTRM
jgi:hypothetical protein